MRPEEIERRKLLPLCMGGTAIYVLCAGSAVKIGRSTRLHLRVGSIQSSQDQAVYIFWAIRLHDRDAVAVEKSLHKRLRDKPFHLRGEWYAMSPNFAIAEIKDEILRGGFESVPDLEYGYDRDAA